MAIDLHGHYANFMFPGGPTRSQVDEGIAAVELQRVQLPAKMEPSQVRIAVKAASVNFPDLLMMQEVKFCHQNVILGPRL